MHFFYIGLYCGCEIKWQQKHFYAVMLMIIQSNAENCVPQLNVLALLHKGCQFETHN